MDDINYRGADCIRRYKEPVLTCDDIPYASNLTFNGGVIRVGDEYIMLFRNDWGCSEQDMAEGCNFKGTNIGLARSKDGVKWDVEPEPVFDLKALHIGEYGRAYDPRITYIDGTYYVCFAVDTRHGIHGGIFRTDDFHHFEMISVSTPDNRNMVIFPEKINGNYVRLERPMQMYSSGGKCHFDIWLSESPDMVYWGKSRLVLGHEKVLFCNDKIGPGAPPIKTEKGWLTLFHSVDVDPERGKNGWEKHWRKRYCIGIMLLDLNDPSIVIGRSETPLMVPEAPYEIDGGFRNNTLFPCAMIRDAKDPGLIRIYYGAADAFMCLAEAREEELIALCTKTEQ